MKNSKDSLGDRMKEYENVSRTKLTRRTPVILRIDGRAFHTLTRNMIKPFDTSLIECMQFTTQALCAEVQNTKFAYMQSDEISLLITDYTELNTQSWFGNQVQKMTSIAASVATLEFNDQMRAYDFKKARATFDARVFNIPKEEVTNYFIWRQQDCIRNSIQSVAQANFSSTKLHGLNCNQLQELLFTEKGINWSELPNGQKNGYSFIKKQDWVCVETPVFTQDRMFTGIYV